MLTEFEDRLSTIPRWGIVRTIQQQKVDQHSFRVALIADKVADQWFGLNALNRYEVVMAALYHDQEEAASGDIPSIVNDLVDKGAIRLRYVDQLRTPFNDNPVVHMVVKIADKMEAVEFLNSEMAMGNLTVVKVLDHVMKSLLRVTVECGMKDKAIEWLRNYGYAYQTDPMDRRTP